MSRKPDPALAHAITPPVFDKKKLHRSRLVDLLHANMERRLQIVAAPAGYGKTTLLADFASESDTPACWVRLAEGLDIDVQQIVMLVVSSLRKRFRRLSKVADPRITSTSSPESAARILSAWIEEHLDENFALLVDDAHVLNSHAQLLAFVDELLTLRPSEFTLILAGREVPELALAKLMAQGDLAGFGPHDLSFSKEEIQGLAALVTGVRLSDPDADALVEATRGWVTGVLLTGILARHTLGQIGAEGSALVYEYLASVILNRLPEETRRFALEASVLPLMTADGCNEVLQRDDSGRVLAALLRMGIFLEVSEGEGRVYEFHPLFRAFLRETLSGSDPSRILRLRLRAASYLERSGSVDPAFHLYLEARAISRAARLADRHGMRMLESGRTETMKVWWGQLTQAQERPISLGVALATAFVDQGNVNGAEDILLTLEKDEREIPNRLVVKIANLRAEIAFQRDQLARCIEIVDGLLKRPARMVDLKARTTSHRLRAVALARLNKDPDGARRSARAALNAATRCADRSIIARALLTNSYVLDVTGDHRGANRAAEQAHDLLRSVGTPVELASSLNNLANARHKEGRFEDAARLYGEALKHARQAASHLREANILFGQGDLFNDVGMARQAAELYGEGLSIATRLENSTLLHFGCIQTCVLYRRRGSAAIAHEWMKRGVEFSLSGRHPASTTIQIAALELSASPSKAADSLLSLLSDKGLHLSGEEQAVSWLLLAKSDMQSVRPIRIDDYMGKALVVAGVHGAEQALAAELAFDSELLAKFRVAGTGSPVLALVLARIEEMRTFRALHSEVWTITQAKPQVGLSAFGIGEIRLSGHAVHGLKPQPKEVLFYLVDKKAVGKDELAERFWPTHSAGRRAANIHTSIHAIRRIVGKDVITLSDGVYSISNETDLQYDVGKFEKAASVAERLPSGDPRRLFALTEAINNYGGPFLSETDTPWAEQRRRSLELRYLDLVAGASSEALTRDQPERALEMLRRALSIDPLRDDFNYRLIEALGRLGRVREIVAHYQKYSHELRQELGLDPPTPIRDLYDRLIS
jgi:LuxR family transcriptional regulator, maltose regulon positive regulatory protein